MYKGVLPLLCARRQ